MGFICLTFFKLHTDLVMRYHSWPILQMRKLRHRETELSKVTEPVSDLESDPPKHVI